MIFLILGELLMSALPNRQRSSEKKRWEMVGPLVEIFTRVQCVSLTAFSMLRESLSIHIMKM